MLAFGMVLAMVMGLALVTNPILFSGEKTTGFTSGALIKDSGSGATASYAGTSCTNQFPRSLSAAGAATCASVAVASDVSGLGTGVATFLGTPSSANLAAAVTDETGSGALVFGTSPSFTTDLTTPVVKLSASSNQAVFQSGGTTGTLTWTPTTANKTVTLPDATGTLPIIIASSGTASSTTNSASETNLVVVTIPAGIMGANGRLSIQVLYKYVGTAGTKTATVRYSTSSGDTSGGTIIAGNVATTATQLTQNFGLLELRNSNSTSAQIFPPTGASTGQAFGVSVTAPGTAAINTANVSYLNLNALVANSGDTAQVVGYTVTLYPGT